MSAKSKFKISVNDLEKYFFLYHVHFIYLSDKNVLYPKFSQQLKPNNTEIKNQQNQHNSYSNMFSVFLAQINRLRRNVNFIDIIQARLFHKISVSQQIFSGYKNFIQVSIPNFCLLFIQLNLKWHAKSLNNNCGLRKKTRYICFTLLIFHSLFFINKMLSRRVKSSRYRLRTRLVLTYDLNRKSSI